MKIFITIAIVMMAKFMNRRHNSCRDENDDSIHKVRNAFVPFNADDVVIICEF
jgi:hypothetical protein